MKTYTEREWGRGRGEGQVVRTLVSIVLIIRSDIVSLQLIFNWLLGNASFLFFKPWRVAALRVHDCSCIAALIMPGVMRFTAAVLQLFIMPGVMRFTAKAEAPRHSTRLDHLSATSVPCWQHTGTG